MTASRAASRTASRAASRTASRAASRARAFRVLALLFAVVIIGIIFTADIGRVYDWFGFLYNYPYGDTVGHFVLMGILSLLVALGFTSARTRIGPLHPLRTCLILALLITLEEISQLFLANRTFSLVDLSADYAGVFLLGELGAWIKKKLNTKTLRMQ